MMEYDYILDAIEDGFDVQQLYAAIPLDEDAFWWYVDHRKLTPTMMRKLHDAIREWRDQGVQDSREYPLSDD